MLSNIKGNSTNFHIKAWSQLESTTAYVKKYYPQYNTANEWNHLEVIYQIPFPLDPNKQKRLQTKFIVI